MEHFTANEYGHGRVEQRQLRTTTLLTVQERWPGLAQGFEVTRTRTVGGQTTVEVEYGITSLAPENADATRLLGLLRDHWRIENCLHYVRDVTLGEDACRVRRGNAPIAHRRLGDCRYYTRQPTKRQPQWRHDQCACHRADRLHD